MDGQALDKDSLAVIFTEARTHRHWSDVQVPDSTLRRIYETSRLGPTSANCSPLRVVFLRTPEAKQKLRPAMSRGNLRQTMDAPVVALLATDLNFVERMPELFPYADARTWFGTGETLEREALRNSTLQAAYLIIAARAHGLDCGPMSGFDAELVNKEFFQGGNWQINIIVNLGYGEAFDAYRRLPRLPFDDACRLE